MKRTAILAAVVASLAAPAFADASSFAFQHFNQDQDSRGDIRVLNDVDGGVVVSTRNSSALAQAFEIRNNSVESTGELRGLNGATVYSGTPAFGADIFAELRAAAAEDEG